MKTIIFTITTAIATFVSTMVSAHETENNRYSVEHTIEQYIAASVDGQPQSVSALLSEEFRFSSASNQGESTKFNKKQVVQHLNGLHGVHHNCKTNYRFVEKNANYSIARIDYTFENFTKTEYVTISNTDKGWKIQGVDVSY